jgi:hypothetical protein
MCQKLVGGFTRQEVVAISLSHLLASLTAKKLSDERYFFTNFGCQLATNKLSLLEGFWLFLRDLAPKKLVYSCSEIHQISFIVPLKNFNKFWSSKYFLLRLLIFALKSTHLHDSYYLMIFSISYL